MIPDPSRRRCIADFTFDAQETVVPAGDGRRKKIQVMSISPLDRLLSQAQQKDEITMRVACEGDFGNVQKSIFDFDFETSDVNKL